MIYAAISTFILVVVTLAASWHGVISADAAKALVLIEGVVTTPLVAFIYTWWSGKASREL